MQTCEVGLRCKGRQTRHTHLLEVQHRMRAASDNPGKMYEVEIAHPESSLLDLDAPVMEQSQAIQNALGRHAEAPRHFTFGQEGWSGKNAYMAAAGNHWSGMPNASQMLFKKGVPGVRYLDEGSRGLPASAKKNRSPKEGSRLFGGRAAKPAAAPFGQLQPGHVAAKDRRVQSSDTRY